MSSLVIVGIPEQQDYVWQVSSEKVPHITLLYLGDASDVDPDEYDKIVEFVEHASNLMNPFYMDVDYRGTLGKDDADVLFFEKGWDYKKVNAFRDQLLQNQAIKKAFNSAEDQYDEWIPHLTLGYPTTPAKKIDPNRSFYSVRFDRIAVWLGDYEGPTFRMKYNAEIAGMDSPYVSMTMSDAQSLLHYGVKGMKWGVRRSRSGSEASTSDRAPHPTPGGVKGQLQKFKDSRNKSLGTPTPVVAKSVTSKKTGKAEVATSGGERQPAHPDAILAKAKSQQLHTSGIASLSNKDLQDLATRLNLEQQVSRLDPPKLSKGQAFINKRLANPNQTASEIQGYKKLADEGDKLIKLGLAKRAAKATVKVATAGAA